MKLDARDRAILAELQSDARLSHVALAERVPLSASQIGRRLRELEEAGIVSGYHAEIDDQAIGFPVVALVRITLEGQQEDYMRAFEEEVTRLPNVLVCFLMAGDYDYLLRVAARDLDDYERLHREHLSRLPHVARIHSNFALRKVVNRALPLGLVTD
ncbi:MAG: Lrp/AsnC family transcriptional regulator [Pseudomonadota bacterium]